MQMIRLTRSPPGGEVWRALALQDRFLFGGCPPQTWWTAAKKRVYWGGRVPSGRRPQTPTAKVAHVSGDSRLRSALVRVRQDPNTGGRSRHATSLLLEYQHNAPGDQRDDPKQHQPAR